MPDFLIPGAMKAGTTSLYRALSRHPEIYLPDREVGYFDVDDITQHPDYFRKTGGQWDYPEYGTAALRQWYAGLFERAGSEQVTGERSTTYLTSDLAPRRIRRAIPDVKLIFMLRDPVRRAHSNYWHLVRTGETTRSLAGALRYRSNVLFERGLYRQHLQKYLEHFPRDQLLFTVFEEFVQERAEVLARICRFLGVDAGGLDEAESMHANPGRYPVTVTGQLALNRVFFHGLLDGQRFAGARRPEGRDGGGAAVAGAVRRTGELFFKGLSRLNCSRRSKPPLDRSTTRMLRYLYEEANEGLSDLTGRDLGKWWPVTRA